MLDTVTSCAQADCNCTELARPMAAMLFGEVRTARAVHTEQVADEAMTKQEQDAVEAGRALLAERLPRPPVVLCTSSTVVSYVGIATGKRKQHKAC